MEIKKLRRNNQLPFQTLAGQVVVVDPKSARVHVLNDTASRMWELLEDDIDPQNLVETLNQEYDLSSAECAQEVRSFLADLEELGLLCSRE